MADVNAPSGQAPAMVPPVRTNEDIVPRNRAFTASSTILSIYIQLHTANIREASYYLEYQANVAKHRRVLAGEIGSAQDSPAPKPAKPARKPKPTTQKARINILHSQEARLLVYKKNEYVYKEDIKLLKREIHLREVAITELRRKLELAQKQKDDIQLTVENFENLSKKLSKLINCQIVDKYKTSLGYNVVPPPYTGNFLPPKPNLSGLQEFVNESLVSELIAKKPVFETSEAKASADKPKDVRKNFGYPLIEDWISDSKDEAESKPKIEKKTVKPGFAKIGFVKSKEQGNPQMDLQDKGVIDSEYSSHMTWNMSYLRDYEEIDRGYVAFGGNPKGGKITSKCTIRTGKLDFENVYFVREIKFNLCSVSQMCDKKNSVLSNDTECIVLSPNFKLTDESQVLLRVPGKNNMYSVDLKNIVPKEASKNETSAILKTFISGIENLIDHKVKVIRCDNETEFKNKEMNQFCEIKDHLGKFDGKADEGFFVRYSLNSKPFRVFNNRTRIVEENLHIRFQPSSDDEKKIDEDSRQESECKDQEKEDNVNNTNNRCQALEDISTFKFSSDHEEDDEEADINNMDITIQVSSTITTRIHKDHPLDQMDVKSAFLYGKIEEEVHVCQPPGFEDPNFPEKVYKVKKKHYIDYIRLLEHAYTDSDYAGASLDRKSTTGGCQFLRCRLISWQCKKQTVVANSTIEAKYMAASSCCKQVDSKNLLDRVSSSVGSSNTDVLELPCLLVLITKTSQSRQRESCKSPTKSLIDVDSSRISIFTVNT
nr:ribonuclease H-like domain-containing protein [Tanacetum cinerariifolium]